VFDKRRNKIILIEIGITSQHNLEIVEMEKFRKYELLAKELQQIYKCETEVIPIVSTWDGMCTKYGSMYRAKLKLDKNIRAYILSVVLKRTIESIFSEDHENNKAIYFSDYEKQEAIVSKLYVSGVNEVSDEPIQLK
jgi:hypothetical protein